MKLNFTPDLNYKPTKQFDLIPTADYQVEILNVERKPTSVGEALVLTLVITQGPYAKRRVWVTLNVVHPEAQVVARAAGELHTQCKICGVTGQLDTDDLCGKPMLARIYATQPKGSFPSKNSARHFRYANGLYPVAAQAQAAQDGGEGWVGSMNDHN